MNVDDEKTAAAAATSAGDDDAAMAPPHDRRAQAPTSAAPKVRRTRQSAQAKSAQPAVAATPPPPAQAVLDFATRWRHTAMTSFVPWQTSHPLGDVEMVLLMGMVETFLEMQGRRLITELDYEFVRDARHHLVQWQLNGDNYGLSQPVALQLAPKVHAQVGDLDILAQALQLWNTMVDMTAGGATDAAAASRPTGTGPDVGGGAGAAAVPVDKENRCKGLHVHHVGKLVIMNKGPV